MNIVCASGGLKVAKGPKTRHDNDHKADKDFFCGHCINVAAVYSLITWHLMPFRVKTLAPVHENIVFLFCTKITSTKYKISLEFCHNHNIKVTNNKHVPLF